MNREFRKYKNILAFKDEGQQPLAFHAENLEVAGLSKDLWDSLKNPMETELISEVEAWSSEVSGTVQIQDLGSQVKTLTINITQICNLHCRYCAAGGDGTYGDPVRHISIEKTLPQIRLFMEKLSPGSSFQFVFLGGEPLLYPEAIRGIGEYAQELAKPKGLKVSFHIITNGTLISQKFIELMKGLRPSVTLSIDGNPETNDRVRPQRNGEGSSEKSLAGLNLMLENRTTFPHITIHAVFNRNNLDVLTAYLFFRQFSVDAFEFTFDINETEEVSNKIYISQMKKVFRVAYEAGQEEALLKIAFVRGVFASLDGQIRKINHCGAGKSLLSIDSRNQIFSCPLEVGHPKEKLGSDLSFQASGIEKLNVLQGSTLVELNDCTRCWARNLCGGGCMYNHKATTGSAHTKHPTYCERTRSLISEVISYYKQCRVEGVAHGQKH